MLWLQMEWLLSLIFQRSFLIHSTWLTFPPSTCHHASQASSLSWLSVPSPRMSARAVQPRGPRGKENGPHMKHLSRTTADGLKWRLQKKSRNVSRTRAGPHSEPSWTAGRPCLTNCMSRGLCTHVVPAPPTNTSSTQKAVTWMRAD